jgi:hypothetical protein
MIFLLLILFTLFPYSSFGASVQEKIVDIVMDNNGIPFFLDNKSTVWGFKRPFILSDPIIIMKNADKIYPGLSITKYHEIFTWSLDGKNSKWPEPNSLFAQYTVPNKIDNKENYSSAASYLSHFSAVQNNDAIIEWGRRYKIGGTSTLETPRSVYHHPEINEVVTSGFTTLVLQNDATIVGWGFNDAGQLGPDSRTLIDPENPAKITVPFTPTHIYSGSEHTIVLSRNGQAFYWGGCKSSASDVAVPNVVAKEGPLSDITAVAMVGDDNVFPDAFLKKDGSIWLSFAPAPDGVHSESCGRVFPDGSKAVQITGMPVPATKVAVGGSVEINFTILALGSDHSLWGANLTDEHPKFIKLPFELP